MKKLIITAASALGVVFAVALANAEDMSNSGSVSGSNQSTAETMRQPAPQLQTNDPSVPRDGVAQLPGTNNSNIDNPSNSDPSLGNGVNNDTSLGNTTGNSSRICTDRNGVIYSRGQIGFDRCLSEKGSPTGLNDQMGGTVGNEAPVGSVQDSGTVNHDSNLDSSSNPTSP
jgi:hypothetical protein